MSFLSLILPLILATSEARPPNIVFILADDLGITDVNAFASHFTGEPGSKLFYETPNLDRLVAKGISFSQAYANQLCSPTRAAILTGQYASRHGFTTATPRTSTYYNQGLPAPEGFSPHDVLEHKDPIKEPQAWINGRTNTALSPELPTLAKVLKTHEASFIGKWHLGGHGALGQQPAAHGFQEIAYFDAGGSSYFNWAKGWNQKAKPWPKMPQVEFTTGDAGPAPYAPYLTDDLTERAISFLKTKSGQKDGKPFFLYFCHFAVHTPIEAPAKSIAHFKGKPQKGHLGHNNETYAAMVKHLDDSVGRIMETLEESGLAENTLLVFTSDNGGVEYTNPAATDNAPFKGGKACLYEGGVRVPLTVFQPGKFEGGKWCHSPVNCVDFLPTLAALTGNQAPENLDGRDLTPLLPNPDAPQAERTFIWHYPFNVIVKHPDNGFPLTPHSAIRVGPHKLIWDWHGKLELYDITKDPYEKSDLASSNPELTSKLHKQLRLWLKENVKAQYFPVSNPAYTAEGDTRPYPFKDLPE